MIPSLHSDVTPNGVAALAAGHAKVANVTGAAKAAGSITFSANFDPADTVTINGTVFTAVASGAAGNQFNIDSTLTLSLDALVVVLNASVVAGVALATYAKSGSTILTVSYDTADEDGNLFTLAASEGTVSGAFLTGGADADALDINKHGVVLMVTAANAAQTWVLTDGLEAGQRLTVALKTKGTSANAVLSGTFVGGTTLTFDTAGEYANLMWTGAGWLSIGMSAALT